MDIDEEKVSFCLSKCGEWYCSYMRGEGGFPCIEYICTFCEQGADERHCEWCLNGGVGNETPCISKDH